MSISNFFEDVFTGNFSNAFKRVEDWWNSMMPELKDFVAKAATDEGKILESLISVAAQDVIAGGFTTVSFVEAGKDVLAKLIAQNIATFNIQYIMALLNIKVVPSAPAAVGATVAPVEVVAQ